MKPVEILALHKGLRFHLAGFGIESIKRHHETSTELSRTSGDDVHASQSIILGRLSKMSRGGGHETVEISALHKGFILHLAGFDI